MILILFALIIFSGSLLNYVFKKYPHLQDTVNLIDNDALYQKIDVNTASHEELVHIPYIGDYTAKRIIEYRRERGPFTSLHELKSVKGIKDKNFLIFSKYLTISHSK